MNAYDNLLHIFEVIIAHSSHLRLICSQGGIMQSFFFQPSFNQNQMFASTTKYLRVYLPKPLRMEIVSKKLQKIIKLPSTQSSSSSPRSQSAVWSQRCSCGIQTPLLHLNPSQSSVSTPPRSLLVICLCLFVCTDNYI